MYSERARAAFDAAESFYASARRLQQPERADGLTTFVNQLQPAIVCLAFSVELYLKAIGLLEYAEPRKVHDYADLFRDLPAATKGTIVRALGEQFGQPEMTEAAFVSGLLQIATSFVDWRYIHDEFVFDRSRPVQISPVRILADVLRTEAIRRGVLDGGSTRSEN